MRGAPLAIVAVLAISAVASAQVDDRWERGVQLRAQGRDAEALAVFQELHRDTGASRALAQVALAEQALGRWNDAAAHLDQALAQPDAWIERNRATLERARAEIAQHAGTPEPASSGGDETLPVVGGVLLGVAGAATVVAVIGSVLWEVHAAHWNSAECFPVGSTRESACQDVDDSAYRAAYSAIGFGIGAVVLAGVGIALLVVDGEGGSEQAELRCGPGGGLGVFCSGRF